MLIAFLYRTRKVICCVAVGVVLCLKSSAQQPYDLKDNTIRHARNGQLLMERDQYDAAIEEFKAAIRLNPYASMAASLYNNLGLAYTRQQQFDLAYVSFQRACRLQPANALYYRNLLNVYSQAGQLSHLTQYLNQRLLENPSNAELWFMLGLSYQKQTLMSQAKQCFDQFIRLEPESQMAQAAREAFK